jgi:hypothetical protein
MGGLGNQMFQYALGLRLARELRSPVRFDTVNGFRGDVYGRKFALGEFNAQAEPARPDEIPAGMSWRGPWLRIAKAIWSTVPATGRRVVLDKDPFRFDEAALAPGAQGPYYFGYWQNEGYFSPVADSLRRDFTLRASPPAAASALMAEMAGCRSVSVHVRRKLGFDARGRPIRKARQFHGECGADYYARAIEAVGTGPGTVCYVFSDDPHWAKANLRLPAACRYVSDVCPCSDGAEIVLMASCNHHVVANSSFSWWGAWLGANPGKIVIAPEHWLRGSPAEEGGVCPPQWLRV